MCEFWCVLQREQGATDLCVVRDPDRPHAPLHPDPLVVAREQQFLAGQLGRAAEGGLAAAARAGLARPQQEADAAGASTVQQVDARTEEHSSHDRKGGQLGVLQMATTTSLSSCSSS